MTDDEKIEAATKEIFDKVVPVNLDEDKKQELYEKTRRQVAADRQRLINTLMEAEEELKTLKWHDLRALQVNTPVKGLRGVYIIVFGNFVQAPEGKWIYRPTGQQILKNVKRWNKKGPCQREAIKFRKTLQPTIVEDEEKRPKEIESPALIELRKDLLDQINEIRSLT